MNVCAGLAVLVAYLVGESKGCGELVWTLTRWETKNEEWLQKQYDDEEGVGFPYIPGTGFISPFSLKLLYLSIYVAIVIS